VAVQCECWVVIVVKHRAYLSVSQQSHNSRRISTIGWLIYCMHISTIIVCVGSSTVPVMGLFGWQCNASNGVIFIGVLARILIYL
jgi:hypothetical protein